MKNILNDADYADIKSRIKNLSEDHSRLWGQMAIDEMLIHCKKQLQLALGEQSASPQGSPLLRTSLGRWLLLSTIPWPKGAMTPTEMNAKKTPFSSIGFESEKRELLDYLEKVRNKASLSPHPFFGKLNKQDWARLIYKHLDHHLRQFGS